MSTKTQTMKIYPFLVTVTNQNGETSWEAIDSYSHEKLSGNLKTSTRLSIPEAFDLISRIIDLQLKSTAEVSYKYVSGPRIHIEDLFKNLPPLWSRSEFSTYDIAKDGEHFLRDIEVGGEIYQEFISVRMPRNLNDESKPLDHPYDCIWFYDKSFTAKIIAKDLFDTFGTVFEEIDQNSKIYELYSETYRGLTEEQLEHMLKKYNPGVYPLTEEYMIEAHQEAFKLRGGPRRW